EIQAEPGASSIDRRKRSAMPLFALLLNSSASHARLGSILCGAAHQLKHRRKSVSSQAVIAGSRGASRDTGGTGKRSGTCTATRHTEPYRRSFQRMSLAPLVLEAFGLTNDTSRYALLSDGGTSANSVCTR